jgi:hypothetical protein
MRIKFPPTYPLIYKTLRIDSKLTTAEAIQFISETLNVAIQGNVGLYIPQERLWLDPNTPLSHYEQLQEVVRVFSSCAVLLSEARLRLSWCNRERNPCSFSLFLLSLMNSIFNFSPLSSGRGRIQRPRCSSRQAPKVRWWWDVLYIILSIGRRETITMDLFFFWDMAAEGIILWERKARVFCVGYLPFFSVRAICGFFFCGLCGISWPHSFALCTFCCYFCAFQKATNK